MKWFLLILALGAEPRTAVFPAEEPCMAAAAEIAAKPGHRAVCLPAGQGAQA